MGKYEAEDNAVSPKVLWPFLVAVALTALAAALSAITPETLSALGPFAVPAAMGLLAAGQFITGYMKKDPVREQAKEDASDLRALTRHLAKQEDPPANGTAV